MKVTRITTESGSVYTLFETSKHGQFLVCNNWPVDAEAPALGQRWLVRARKGLEQGHPKRIPGGGKYTSIVVSIEEAFSEDSAEGYQALEGLL